MVMEDRRARPQQTAGDGTGRSRRWISSGAGWTTAVAVALAALVLFALFACKTVH
jgi:hypothetical protein